MAGLDDYQFYTNLREKESPFWQKSQDTGKGMGISDYHSSPKKRPTEFPEQLKGTTLSSNSSLKPSQRPYELEQYSNKGIFKYY